MEQPPFVLADKRWFHKREPFASNPAKTCSVRKFEIVLLFLIIAVYYYYMIQRIQQVDLVLDNNVVGCDAFVVHRFDVLRSSSSAVRRVERSFVGCTTTYVRVKLIREERTKKKRVDNDALDIVQVVSFSSF